MSLTSIREKESLEDFLKARRALIDSELTKCFEEPRNEIEEVACYSLMLPSKRLRPILCLETAVCLGESTEFSMPAALALEMLHTYSLVHDDLPAMDDDDLRRGQPTSHKKYGEARAILAGDGLLTKAFELLSTAKAPAEVRCEWAAELSRAAGMRGMVLGQDEDIYSMPQTLEDLENLHRHKTAALISASVVMGAIAARAKAQDTEILRDFGLSLGLAFQIQDDVLDVLGGDEMGKPNRSDEKNDKLTYVSLMGLEEAKEQGRKWYERSVQCLQKLSLDQSRLRELAEFVLERKV